MHRLGREADIAFAVDAAHASWLPPFTRRRSSEELRPSLPFSTTFVLRASSVYDTDVTNVIVNTHAGESFQNVKEEEVTILRNGFVDDRCA